MAKTKQSCQPACFVLCPIQRRAEVDFWPATNSTKQDQTRQAVCAIYQSTYNRSWLDRKVQAERQLKLRQNRLHITFISLFASQSCLAIINKPNVETYLLNKRYSLAVSLGMNSWIRVNYCNKLFTLCCAVCWTNRPLYKLLCASDFYEGKWLTSPRPSCCTKHQGLG